MRWIFTVLMGILSSLPMVLIAEENAPVQLAGLQIVGPGRGLNGTELRAFHQQSGTTLALVVTTPANKMIVDVDDSKCSLEKFTDDRGYNLLDGVDWGGFPKISEDGRLALIEVSSKNNPSHDATRLYVKGNIYLRVAASERTEKIENLELKVGAQVNIQQESIQVKKAQIEDNTLTLVLQTSLQFRDDLKDVRFYTPDGNALEIYGRGSFSFGNACQLEYNLDINSTPKFLKTEFDLWKEPQALTLPFELESGIGF